MTYDPDTSARRDGRRPAVEELWSCPSCGKPATAFVSFYRVIVCGACRWTFTVEAHKPFEGLGDDPYAASKAYAEQQVILFKRRD